MKNHSKHKICIIVPCFNESLRISKSEILSLVFNLKAVVFLIDDGSTDNTWETIKKIEDESEYVKAFRIAQNVGKAQAIWHGLQLASKDEFHFFGTYDADSPIEIREYKKAFQYLADHDELLLVSGARVILAGGKVKRRPSRRWIGRVIATLISFLIRIDFYDPQSPLKVFRYQFFSKASAPKSRWFHDIEFILKIPFKERRNVFYEFPIEKWTDVGDGSISLSRVFPICFDITRILIIGLLQGKKETKSK